MKPEINHPDVFAEPPVRIRQIVSRVKSTGYLLKCLLLLTFYHTIWVRDRLRVAKVNYIRTKKFARRFLCLKIHF